MSKTTICDLLMFEEGYRSDPYYCSEGYPTIGIGTKIGPKNAALDCYTFTVSDTVAKCFLAEEIKHIRAELIKHKWYVALNEDRQIIVKSMCYQLGINGVMKFKKMIGALSSGDYVEASRQSLDSKWAKQTPQRAERHAAVLESGDIDRVYGEII